MKSISSEWTADERLYVIEAIAERIFYGHILAQAGAQTIVFLATWTADALEKNRAQIEKDAGTLGLRMLV